MGTNPVSHGWGGTRSNIARLGYGKSVDDGEDHQSTGRFEFEGFSIPKELAVLTGGGEETWEAISRLHMAAYDRYGPIHAGHDVLEVGCGVGRDAIPLIQVLGPEGSYLGVDITRPSVSWCQDNITVRHPNAIFEHFDIYSKMYNPSGTMSASEVSFPIEDGRIDRIILQSVFTHMFEREIVHFLSEFRRVLRPEGLVFATFFVLDDESMKLTTERSAELTFRHARGEGCRITDPLSPKTAVGYTPQALDRMLRRSGMAFEQPVHYGFWSGRQDTPDGQDIAILKRSDRGRMSRLQRKLLGTSPKTGSTNAHT